jgi:hypothetical protein
MTKRYLIFIIIIGILINTSFVFAQEVPSTPGEVEQAGETLKEIVKQESPGVFRQTWNDFAGFFKTIWNSYIFPLLRFAWNEIVSILGKEVEQRRPEVEEEFRKETEEMKEDIPKTTKSLWQRFKDLID